MAHLFYMSLPGVGRWDHTIKGVGAQLRPYSDFLRTAIKAATARTPVLAWRPATAREQREFQRRLDERFERLAKKARKASKRRNRRIRQKPAGVWIVLEPPPWQPEEPDDTFDAFLEALSVHSEPECSKASKISRNDCDREGRALLLDRVPAAYEPEPSKSGTSPRPTAEKPHGKLIWLRPDTYTLTRQRHALQRLDNAPSSRLAPLIRLLSTRAFWPEVDEVSLTEGDWQFLKRGRNGALRDGTQAQRQFVEIGLGTPDFAILEGPPGSGKTTAICELIVQLLKSGKRVLLVASTHVAVDNVLERLIAWQDGLTGEDKVVLPVRVGEEARITSDVIHPFTLKRLRTTWSDEILDFLDAPTKDVIPAGDAARRMLKQALTGSGERHGADSLTQLILGASNLASGTTIGILQHPAIKGDFHEPFDVMILDEASKTTFSEFLVPALYARKWIVVGDIKQLSPYVEEVHLSENLQRLVPQSNARAAVHAFAASLRGPRQVRSLLALASDEVEIACSEAAERGVDFAQLDTPEFTTLRGFSHAIPALLWADLVMGSPEALQRYEHRLPNDLRAEGGKVPALPDWQASRRAFVAAQRKRKRFIDLSEELNWGSEVAWRLTRSYELRHNDEEKQRYDQELARLLPVTLDDSWFGWRKSKPRKSRETGYLETPREALERELGTMRRVVMPSILELLQTGFERLPGWDQGVALTDGLPEDALSQRLVSLTHQHRMHPHISAFPREQFYTGPRAETDDPTYEWAEHQSQGLLQDASDLEAARDWSYRRYARRALWLDVAPGRQRGRRNSNLAEAQKIDQELQAFIKWACANPRRDGGQKKPWEVAVLTFYRGQEAVLREILQKASGLFGNTRNFRFPKSSPPAVTVTLCTVDRFQGHEADLVFLSFVKSGSVGFLNSPNRLNVAITRARFQLVLVGHRAYFSSERCRSPLLRRLGDSEHYLGDIGWESEL